MGQEYTRTLNIISDGAPNATIQLYDDLNGGLMWEKDTGLGDCVVELTTAKGFSYLKSLHIKTRTTDAAEGDSVIVSRSFPYPGSLKIAVEALFYIADISKIQSINIACNYANGVNSYLSELLWQSIDNKFYFRTDGETSYEIPNAIQPLLSSAWQKISFEIDVNTNQYIKAIINNISYPAPNINIYNQGEFAYVVSSILLSIVTIGAEPAEAWFDNIAVRVI